MTQRIKSRNYCEICRERPPAYFLTSNLGVESRICKLCAPMFQAQSIIREMSMQNRHLQDKLKQYLEFMAKHKGEPVLYKASASFTEDYEKIINRLNRLVFQKKYGRQAKSHFQRLEGEVKVLEPEEKKEFSDTIKREKPKTKKSYQFKESKKKKKGKNVKRTKASKTHHKAKKVS